MKLLECELKNFMSYQGQKIDFRKLSVTSIIGRFVNNWARSNGTGKSTIFESLTYCIFGKTSKEDVLMQGEEIVEVSWLFEIGDETIRITRGKNNKGGYLYFGINGIDKSEGKNETQEMIEKKIGVNYYIFIATIFFQQFEQDTFSSATPTDRKTYLKDILNLGLYDNCYEEVNKELKQIQTQLDSTETKKSFLENKLKDIDVKSIEKEIEANNKRLVKSKEELSELKNKQKEEREVLVNYNRILDKINDLETQLKDNKEELKQYQTNDKEIRVPKKIELDFSEDDVEEIRTKGELLKEKINELKIASANLKSRISMDNERIETLSKNDTCPTCEADLKDKNKKSKLINKIHASIEFLETSLQENNNVIISHEIKLDDLRKQYKEKKELLKKSEQDNNSIDILIEKKLNIQSFIEKIRTKISVLNEKIKELEKEGDKYNIDNLKDYKKLIEKMEKQIEDLVYFLSEKNNQLKIFEKTVKEKDGYETETKKLREEVNNYSVLKEVFGKNGIVAQLIKQSIEEIQDNANSILKDILGNEFEIEFETLKELKNKNADLRDTLEIFVNTKNGRRGYKSFSGGERSIINFAIRMSLSQLLSKLNKVRFNFIVLDEIFSAIDEWNSEKLIRVINYLKNYFQQIFIISHTSIKDSFINQIIVEKDKKGISRIVEVN